MDLKNKTVMVVGTGISGIGAVDLLNKVGADCILYDGNEKLDRQKVQEKLTRQRLSSGHLMRHFFRRLICL